MTRRRARTKRISADSRAAKVRTGRPQAGDAPREFVLFSRTEDGPFTTRRSSADMYVARVDAVSVRQAVFRANTPEFGWRSVVRPIGPSEDACRRRPSAHACRKARPA
jgi:hypothetical protein